MTGEILVFSVPGIYGLRCKYENSCCTSPG